MESKLREIANLLLTDSSPDIGLLGGKTGEILFLFYCAKYLKNEVYEDRACELLNDVIENISDGKIRHLATHCSGLAGFGWMLEHLEKNGFIDVDTNELLEEFDDVIVNRVNEEILKDHYDFLHGFMGMILFLALRANKNKSLVVFLNDFIDRFEIMVEYEGEGIKMISVVDHETGEQGYNISLSHGMAGVLVPFLKLYEVDGIDKGKTEKIINGLVRYILDQEIDNNFYGSFFPSFSIESSKKDIYRSRLGWCYGDLGIAMALWNAGRVMGNKQWSDKALDVLMFSSKRRDLKTNSVLDAGLCHGTAGIGHIFYRMYIDTGNDEFLKTASYWMDKTLGMAVFDDGLAGYKSLFKQEEWIKEYCVLTGVSGIGLAILSYIYGIDPVWDACLLLS